MSYSLYIQKLEGSFSEQEWRKIVDSMDSLRFVGENNRAINPATGKEIEIECSPLDVAVRFPDGKWRPVFFWMDDTISFYYMEGMEKPQNEIRRLASAICHKIDGLITGDEGEDYNW